VTGQRADQTFEQRWSSTRAATEKALATLFNDVPTLSPDEVRRRLASVMDECEDRLMMIVKDERQRVSADIDRAIHAETTRRRKLAE
jgi:CRISPR/Cas system-associated protein Csm6